MDKSIIGVSLLNDLWINICFIEINLISSPSCMSLIWTPSRSQGGRSILNLSQTKWEHFLLKQVVIHFWIWFVFCVSLPNQIDFIPLLIILLWLLLPNVNPCVLRYMVLRSSFNPLSHQNPVFGLGWVSGRSFGCSDARTFGVGRNAERTEKTRRSQESRLRKIFISRSLDSCPVSTKCHLWLF